MSKVKLPLKIKDDGDKLIVCESVPLDNFIILTMEGYNIKFSSVTEKAVLSFCLSVKQTKKVIRALEANLVIMGKADEDPIDPFHTDYNW